MIDTDEQTRAINKLRRLKVDYGIGCQFFISRLEKQPDGTWKNTDEKTVSASELTEIFEGWKTLHHPDPLPAHVDVTIPEELIDD